MTTFELETTYLGLDGAGRVTPLPVGPDFWQTIGENAAAQESRNSAENDASACARR